ncbi:MAG: type II toxin-antitoxin system RelB/DinJ family antitoxin [Campylobacter sp.]|nr:type II toxin-antitoxin system RelB/DinJ family antitoxin [Campylobacter sp.]
MNTTITFKIDKDLKSDFSALVKEFGMDLTTAFNVFARAVVRDRKIPFEINAPYSDKTIKEILNESKKIKEGIRNNTLKALE